MKPPTRHHENWTLLPFGNRGRLLPSPIPGDPQTEAIPMTQENAIPMAIRPAIEADSEELLGLFQENDRHHAKLLPGEPRAPRTARSRRQVQEWIGDRNGL